MDLVVRRATLGTDRAARDWTAGAVTASPQSASSSHACRMAVFSVSVMNRGRTPSVGGADVRPGSRTGGTYEFGRMPEVRVAGEASAGGGGRAAVRAGASR